MPRRHRHPGLHRLRRSIPRLYAPLSTLRRHPRGYLRMTRGRCGSLLLHRNGLAPSTSCRPSRRTRGSMAGLCTPLPTLRLYLHRHLRTAQGRCGSLLLHRGGLSPPTPCRFLRRTESVPGADMHEISLGPPVNRYAHSGLRTCALGVCPDGCRTRKLPIFSDRNMRATRAAGAIVMKAIHHKFSMPTTILAATVLVGGNGTAAQTAAPTSIITPDKVETSIGTLEYKDGAPSKETVDKAYDYLDLMHGVEAFVNAYQGASVSAIFKGSQDAGIPNNTALIFSELMDSKSLFLTPNADTVYF